jgi:hypothetical protein
MDCYINNTNQLFENIFIRLNHEQLRRNRRATGSIPAKDLQMHFITRNMGQDGDGHAHFDPIWRPNITINYMGVDQNIKF